MRAILFLLAIGILGSGAAAADPPKMLHLVQTVQIKAPPDKVWEVVKDFDGLAKWHPGFSNDQLVSGANGKVGAVRKLTIKDGPVITEKLTAYDPIGHSYSYRITDSPLPITDYSSKISVRPAKDGSEVVWSGRWKRKNTSDNPPEAESDAGTIKLVTGVYRGGLDNLKKMIEGG